MTEIMELIDKDSKTTINLITMFKAIKKNVNIMRRGMEDMKRIKWNIWKLPYQNSFNALDWEALRK